ncbi:hypothetical protein D1BOALGB6SA_338 [Olavius sp. associated proteobacterium Delta 1]|nr:hypothetical protein D1BOALGB6SA_338 [Olavius sp. associated proteobacterium Delta 1]
MILKVSGVSAAAGCRTGQFDRKRGSSWPNSEPQNRRISNVECRRVESLRFVFFIK